MAIKGQILEIPKNSKIYQPPEVFSSKEQELRWKARKINYGLFDGFLVGEHSGLDAFQIGQRKGINVGGKAAPLFVIAKDLAENRLIVGEGEDHPGLLTTVFKFQNTSELFTDYCKEHPYSKELHGEVNAELLHEILPATIYFFSKELFLEFQNPVSVLLPTKSLKFNIDQQYIIDLSNLK